VLEFLFVMVVIAVAKKTNSDDNKCVVGANIRYADPDLTIVVGVGDGYDNNGTERHPQRRYVYHSVVLALQSKYIDAALSSGMRETVHKELSFPDLSPETWDLMMKYVTPGNVEPMSTHHARMLMVWYGKYDFTMGLHMCDVVLAKLVKKYMFMGKLPIQRQHAVEVFVEAHTLGLPETTAAGIQQTKRVLAGLNTICRTPPAKLDSGGGRAATGLNPDDDIARQHHTLATAASATVGNHTTGHTNPHPIRPSRNRFRFLAPEETCLDISTWRILSPV
jgi:hypothetical protein